MTPEQRQITSTFTRTQLWGWVSWYGDKEFYYIPDDWLGIVDELRKNVVK